MTSRQHVATLTVLTSLFLLRIVAQALQHWLPQSWLPGFNAFQGGSLQYSTLLPVQLIILGMMVKTCWRQGREISVPSQRLGRLLAWFGSIYLAGSLLRILIGVFVVSSPAWFSTWIPAFFHLVLSGFVVVAANYHRRPAHVGLNQ